MNYPFLYEVLKSIEKFDEQTPDSQKSLNAFRIFLNEQHYRKEGPTKLMKEHDIDVSFLDNEICKQVIMLGRHTKILLRKGMESYPELVNEDFTYLYRLMDYASLTKMQLIEKNAHEKQSGLEIIKRLIKHGVVEEFQDPDDGRSKRIAVTKKGRKLFMATVQDVDLLSQILTGKLNTDQKQELLEMLKKLNFFHQVIYAEYRNSSIDEIKEILD